MYLHLGSSVSVRAEEIVGIFDLDNASTSHITRSFLRSAEEEGLVINVGQDLPKSAVVCCPLAAPLYLPPLQRHPVKAFGERRFRGIIGTEGRPDGGQRPALSKGADGTERIGLVCGRRMRSSDFGRKDSVKDSPAGHIGAQLPRSGST